MQSFLLAVGLLVALVGSALALRVLAAALGVRVPARVLAIGVALSIALFIPWLFEGQLLAPTEYLGAGQVPGMSASDDFDRYETLNDVIFQFLPWELELRRLWRSGSFGFWSDRLEGGSSLWVNPQASVLSPTAWIARAFALENFFLVKGSVQVLVCFLGLAVLVRRLGAGWQSAVLAGCAGAVSGAMMPWVMFTHTAAVAWVPWTTTGLLAVARSPSARRLVGAGLAVGLLLLAGHPEVAFAGGCLGVAVVLWLRSRNRSLSSQALSVVAAATLGFLLAAPAVLPFLAALPESQRAEEIHGLREALTETELGMNPTTWFLDDNYRALAAPLHPNAFGRPFVDGYSGPFSWLESASGYAGVWALAGVGLCVGLWLRRSLVLIAFSVVVLLLAADFVPLLWIARSLPGFDAMAFPRAALVASLALCAAAGLGFDDIRRRAPSLIGWSTVGVMALLSLVAGGRANIELSVVAWSMVAFMLLHGDRHRFRVVVPLLLIGMTQLPWAWRMMPKSDPESFFPESAVFDVMAATVEQGSAVMPRILGLDYHAYPSVPTVYGLHQVRSHNPMAPAPWLKVNRAAFGFAPDAMNYFAPVTQLHPQWLDALGIGVVLSAPNLEGAGATGPDGGRAPSFDLSGEPGFELVLDAPLHRVYRNSAQLDRWFVASSWEAVSPEMIDRRLKDLPHPKHAFVTGSAEEAVIAAGQTRMEGPALLAIEARPGVVDLAVQSPDSEGVQSDFLLATSLYGPQGWSVEARDADGRSVETAKTRIHGAFLGAWVGPEAATLHLRYLPPLLRPALAGSIIGLIVVVLLLRRPRSS